MKKKKLKYVLEARLPFPSQAMTLCVRAEGNGNALRHIAFFALQQLFEVKWKKISQDIHGLTHKRPAKTRDASGRFVTKILLPVKVSEEITNQLERFRLVVTYEATLCKAALTPRLNSILSKM